LFLGCRPLQVAVYCERFRAIEASEDSRDYISNFRLLLTIPHATERPQMVKSWLIMFLLATSLYAGVPAKTVIIILGTLHQNQTSNLLYNPDTVKAIVKRIGPSALFVEAQPFAIDSAHSLRKEVAQQGAAFPEIGIWVYCHDSLKIPLYPIDRPDRDKYYKESNYFQRQDAFFARMMAVRDTLKSHDKNELVSTSFDLLWSILSTDLVQNKSSASTTNGQEMDYLSHSKFLALYRLYPEAVQISCLDSASVKTIKSECRFFLAEWAARTQAMSSNIGILAKRFEGKRVVVNVGADQDRKSTRLNSSHEQYSKLSRMPSSA
jgi:hypothetical protein